MKPTKACNFKVVFVHKWQCLIITRYGLQFLINLFKAYRWSDAPKFNIQQLYALPRTVFMCFVFIWEQTATCATSSINWLVFITQMKSVYSAVRTGSLNRAVCASSLKPTGHVMHQQYNIQQLYALPHTVFMCFVFIWEQTATCATYSINW